jgi:hypothetical protein
MKGSDFGVAEPLDFGWARDTFLRQLIDLNRRKLMRSKPIFAIAVIACLAAMPVLAHHSFSSEYDSSKRLSLKGKMVGFEWVNPHSWIHVEVTNPDGTKTLWKGETPPVNVLYRTAGRSRWSKRW